MDNNNLGETTTTTGNGDPSTAEVTSGSPSHVTLVFNSDVKKPEALLNNGNYPNQSMTVDVIAHQGDSGLVGSGISQLSPFDQYKYEHLQPKDNDVEITMSSNGITKVDAGENPHSTVASTASTGGQPIPVKKVLVNPKEFETPLVSGAFLTGEATTKRKNTTQRRQSVTIEACEYESGLQKATDALFRLVRAGDGNEMEVNAEQLERTFKMHRQISENAMFSFNYNTLIFCAAVIAGCGLISNSSTTIIASMLVSPLMGPVVGIAYGLTIHDWNLVRRSLFTECLSLAFCIIMGMLIGLTSGPCPISENWPTNEMYNRGTWQNFYVGLPVAFFSGIGVAVSLLDAETASMVGVAISASLLPPAVNAGILWVAYLFDSVSSDILAPRIATLPCACYVTNETSSTIGPTANATLYSTWFGLGLTNANNGQTSQDHDYTLSDYRQLGAISLSLTLANIALIIVSSMLMFRIKEVLPIRKKVFWDDLKVARNVYTQKAYIQRYVDIDDDYDEEVVNKKM